MPDVIASARELVLGMSAALGLRSNFHEYFELFEVKESTQFEKLHSSWRERTSRSVDHQPGQIGSGDDFVYYDPVPRLKFDEAAAHSWAWASRIVPSNLKKGWVHFKGDTP